MDRRRYTKVFHSFGHSFIDALRVAGVPGEINIALVGHTDPSVNGKYGAKDKAIRFRHRLAEAIASVAYAGLDLSHLTDQQATKGHQGAPRSTKEQTRLHGANDYRTPRGAARGRRTVTNDDQRVQRLPASTKVHRCGTADQGGSDRCTLISVWHKPISLRCSLLCL
jgi:hypothetical protein